MEVVVGSSMFCSCEWYSCCYVVFYHAFL